MYTTFDIIVHSNAAFINAAFISGRTVMQPLFHRFIIDITASKSSRHAREKILLFVKSSFLL